MGAAVAKKQRVFGAWKPRSVESGALGMITSAIDSDGLSQGLENFQV